MSGPTPEQAAVLESITEALLIVFQGYPGMADTILLFQVRMAALPPMEAGPILTDLGQCFIRHSAATMRGDVAGAESALADVIEILG